MAYFYLIGYNLKKNYSKKTALEILMVFDIQ